MECQFCGHIRSTLHVSISHISFHQGSIRLSMMSIDTPTKTGSLSIHGDCLNVILCNKNVREIPPLVPNTTFKLVTWSSLILSAINGDYKFPRALKFFHRRRSNSHDFVVPPLPSPTSTCLDLFNHKYHVLKSNFNIDTFCM
jgi:hypothetical protein